ncbi:MAG TPA: T9SS type A sorting domain-containing protein [Bacteroidia bacterium]|jgi:hypothetical protein|nr:T9SS type A sorting domain-containing protein [Bacteroidia bacterium]
MKKKLCICFSFFIFHFSFSYAQSWLWSTNGKVIGANDFATLDGIASDANGNVFFTGWYYGRLVFGTDTLQSPVNNQWADNPYIAKYSPAGNLIWANAPIGKDSTESEQMLIATDAKGNSYISGYFTDTISFGTHQLTSYQGQYLNTFLTKYDPNGNVKWAICPTFTSICGNFATSICTDKWDNIYLVGENGFPFKFGSYSFVKGNFFVKFDSNGNVIWGKNLGFALYPRKVMTDNSGNVYVTGDFQDTLIFGTYTLTTSVNSTNSYLVKYDSDGNVLWAKQSQIPSAMSGVEVYSATTDKFNNIYLTGPILDTTVFGQDTLLTVLYGHTYVVRYDSNGNVVKAWYDGQKSGGGSAAWSIKTDTNNNLILSGIMGADMVFGKDTIYKPAGSYPNYIAKFDTSGKVICSETFSTTDSYNFWNMAVNPKNNTVYFGGYDSVPISFGTNTVYDNGFLYPFIAKWLPCGDTLTGIRQVKALVGQVSVYPNPNGGAFTIALQNVNEPANVEFYNVLGEEVYQSKLNFSSTQINLGGQPNGVYLYRVIKHRGELIGSGKLIIER